MGIFELSTIVKSSIFGVVITPTVVVVVVVVVGVIGGGLYWLFKGASGSQPIAELRNALADFEAARARDDSAAMARHAARVRQIVADHNLTGTEASGALATVAGH
jgi:hypothetical protein